MNYRAVAHYVGLVLKMECAFMAIPLCVSLYYKEAACARSFAASMALLLCTSLVLDIVRVRNANIYAREGLFTVAVCWIAVSLFGALPYWLSGAVPSFINALFESVSGFTTTAASVITEVELLPRGILFWRNFSLWVGGMGVLVFLIAIVPLASGGRSIHMLRAEIPGHSPGKLVPRLRQSTGILYAIYLGLTLLLFVLLWAGGMPLFDSVLNAMGTTSTGGFSTRTGSIAAYGSAYLEGVTVVFMLLSGMNFNIHYFALSRNFTAIRRNDELRWYFGTYVAASLLITLNIAGQTSATLAQSAHYALFQTASILTTTGLSVSDINVLPQFSKGILLALMFLGACSGSTGGGLKVSRVLIFLRECKHVLLRMMHPNEVTLVKLSGKPVERDAVHAVCMYILVLMGIFGVSVLLVSLDNFGGEVTVASVAACINNIGAGFGLVNQAGSFNEFSPVSKIVLCFDMLLGRLEIFPVMLMFFPRSWRKA